MTKPLHIGIVAGEASGDQLGAGLIESLKKYFPDAVFEGIGGSKMQAEGFTSLFPMDRLSVMGLVEPLKRLPELLRIRRQLYRHFRDNQFDLVIGIDSPDFNLGLEGRLKKAGLTTAHYVSPSVWAWRQGRIHKIARSVDLMVALLPFEAAFYQKHRVPVVCVGHALAEKLPLEPDTLKARTSLGLPEDALILAVMPGSRGSEVESLGRLFLEVVSSCRKTFPELQVVLPAASPERRRQLEALVEEFSELPITLLDGQSLTAMTAADAVLLASGTTALEAMLLKKPMVVSYKMGSITYALFSRLIKVPYISLPNLLANKALVPELVQDNATVENITAELTELLSNQRRAAELTQEFTALHQQLRLGGSDAAAAALAELIEKRD